MTVVASMYEGMRMRKTRIIRWMKARWDGCEEMYYNTDHMMTSAVVKMY